jgi:hypothetical protein
VRLSEYRLEPVLHAQTAEIRLILAVGRL